MRMFSELTKRAQLTVWAASTLITIFSFLMAYDSFKDVAWWSFGFACGVQVLKSLIDFVMGRAPEHAKDED